MNVLLQWNGWWECRVLRVPELDGAIWLECASGNGSSVWCDGDSDNGRHVSLKNLKHASVLEVPDDDFAVL